MSEESTAKPAYKPRAGTVASEVYAVIQPGQAMEVREILETIDAVIDSGVLHSSMQYALQFGEFEKREHQGKPLFYRRTAEEYEAWRAAQPAAVVDVVALASSPMAPTWFPQPSEFQLEQQPAETAPSEVFSCALFSDGRLLIETGDWSKVLSKANTERLVHYLERMVP